MKMVQDHTYEKLCLFISSNFTSTMI